MILTETKIKIIKLNFDKKLTLKIKFWWFLSTHDQVNASSITKITSCLKFLGKNLHLMGCANVCGKSEVMLILVYQNTLLQYQYWNFWKIVENALPTSESVVLITCCALKNADMNIYMGHALVTKKWTKTDLIRNTGFQAA